MKKFINGFIPMLIFGIVGGFMGYFSMKYLDEIYSAQNDVGVTLIITGLLILCLYFILYFHIIIHEGGHFLFGKLTGYQFVSFRIGSFMLIKVNGKLKRKKYNIVGTGGQCLMIPPENEGYDFPYILYNLGGSLANILFGVFSLALYIAFPTNDYISIALILLAGIGISYGLINGIPMQIGGISNDGHNIWSLRKDKEARRAFYLQIYINGTMSKGTRLADMPSSWFQLSEDADLTNPLIVAIGVFRCNYLHDKKEFEKAKEYSLYLLEHAKGLLEVYKNELRCELLFYEIIGLCRKEEINRIYTKELQKYIKATSSYVSRKRLLYSYELLVNKDKGEAQNQLLAFEKAAKTYPYTAEIEGERELIDIVRSL